MKHKNIKLLFGAAMASGVMMLSCTDDLKVNAPDSPESTMGPLRAYVYFGDDWNEPSTRLTIRTDDKWTYTTAGFGAGDTVGVFSRHGNFNIPGGGPLINVPMYFAVEDYTTSNGSGDKATTLQNLDYQVDPSVMSSGEVFMYYPYSPGLGNYDNYDKVNNVMDTVGLGGLELRVEDNGMMKCRDIACLYSATADYLKRGILSGAFYHAMAELILMRGEGFDNPPEPWMRDSITIVMSRGYSHFRVVSYVHNGNAAWTTQLFYQPGYTFNGKPMSEMECRRWKPWLAGQYAFSASRDTIKEGDAYWVVLPTTYASRINSSTTATNKFNTQINTRPFIDYIEMYDNEGRKQKITSIGLKTSQTATPSKYPYNGYREGLIVRMDELGPTVSHVEVLDWKDRDPITDERAKGVSTAAQYNSWAEAYNSYILTGSGEDELLKYGDKENNVWTFYINDDLEFSDNDQPYQINELKDRLVGSNNLFNVTMKNVNIKTPLFKKISGNGGLENIDFDRLYIDYSQVSSPTSIGCIAGEIDATGASAGIEGGMISNCNIINGTVRTSGPVGILAGSMTGGTIKDCNFYGFIQGSSTAAGMYAKLLGETPTNAPTLENATYNNVIFAAQ